MAKEHQAGRQTRHALWKARKARSYRAESRLLRGGGLHQGEDGQGDFNPPWGLSECVTR